MAELSTYNNYLFHFLETNRKTCHMLTAQPSTYDMFWLIELYGRKLQSVYLQGGGIYLKIMKPALM